MQHFTKKDIPDLFALMARIVDGLPPTMTALIIRDYGKDPYRILISCLLSLRARDVVTYPVAKELFMHAHTPEAMLSLPIATIAQIIKPIGFYRRKAVIIHEVSEEIMQRFGGAVPATEQELLSIKHVGRKTASLVLSCAFATPAICVDTHVYRISHHLGLSHAKTPEKTEEELKHIVPYHLWSAVNELLVVWGQNICKPNTKRCGCWETLARYDANT